MGAITVITLLLAYRRQQLLPDPPVSWKITRVGSQWVDEQGELFPRAANLPGSAQAPSPPVPSCPPAITLGCGTRGNRESQSFYSPPPALQAVRDCPAPVLR